MLHQNLDETNLKSDRDLIKHIKNVMQRGLIEPALAMKLAMPDQETFSHIVESAVSLVRLIEALPEECGNDIMLTLTSELEQFSRIIDSSESLNYLMDALPEKHVLSILNVIKANPELFLKFFDSSFSLTNNKPAFNAIILAAILEHKKLLDWLLKPGQMFFYDLQKYNHGFIHAVAEKIIDNNISISYSMRFSSNFFLDFISHEAIQVIAEKMINYILADNGTKQDLFKNRFCYIHLLMKCNPRIADLLINYVKNDPDEFKRLFENYSILEKQLNLMSNKPNEAFLEKILTSFAIFKVDKVDTLPTLVLPPRIQPSITVKSPAPIPEQPIYNLAASPASYRHILLQQPTTADGIRKLFRDYASPGLFTFHWGRHHRPLARKISLHYSSDNQQFFQFLLGIKEELEAKTNPPVNKNGSMMRRLRHAMEVLRQEQDRKPEYTPPIEFNI